MTQPHAKLRTLDELARVLEAAQLEQDLPLEGQRDALVAAALQRGPLGIVSVLTSLYPVVTALAAVVILKERLSRVQLTGVAVAMVAVVLLVV